MIKTKKLICQILMIALILGMTTPVFATHPSEDTGTPYETANVTIDFVRSSNTAAKSITSVSYFKPTTYATVSLTLQELKNGTWVTATGVSPITQSSIVYDRGTVYMVSYWELIKGKSYRLKCTSKDETEGNTFTYTSYSGLA